MNLSISRREAIMRGLTGAAGFWLAGRLNLPSWAAETDAKAAAAVVSGKAKSVIQIWMAGGPPHLDTFDPKPDAGRDYGGSLVHPIPTTVPGMVISELLPTLAKQADKYSLIRSMTHNNNGHETAAYIVQTGWMPGNRLTYPSMGAVVSLFKGYDAGYKGMIPPFIELTEPQGRFQEEGFLESRFKPFATGGDPSQARFIVDGIISATLTDQQQRDRRDLLRNLNTFGQTQPGNPQLQAFAESEENAYEMILGEGAKVFDLTTEKDDLRNLYGRNKFGQCCLMARRLVEKGVPYITINYPGWDTHQKNFQTMNQKLPELDKGIATLLQDLSDRGLLDSTIVWCCGEFGRTPKVQWEPPWDGGRGHWGQVFSALVAGGGFKGGQVIGASDAKGESVKDRPVYPCDLLASMYQLLGIDAHAKLPNPSGADLFVTPGSADGAKSGGILKEIM